MNRKVPDARLKIMARMAKNKKSQNRKPGVGDARVKIATLRAKNKLKNNSRSITLNRKFKTNTFRSDQLRRKIMQSNFKRKNYNNESATYTIVRTVRNNTQNRGIRQRTQPIRNRIPVQKIRNVPARMYKEDLEHMTLDSVISPSRQTSAFASRNNNIRSPGNIQSRLGPQLGGQNRRVNRCMVHVSNLHPNSVSRSDILELFNNVGNLRAVEMQTPGVAVVTFHSESDAISAVQLYHNRSLDGQPMQCKLGSNFE